MHYIRSILLLEPYTSTLSSKEDFLTQWDGDDFANTPRKTGVTQGSFSHIPGARPRGRRAGLPAPRRRVGPGGARAADLPQGEGGGGGEDQRQGRRKKADGRQNGRYRGRVVQAFFRMAICH